MRGEGKQEGHQQCAGKNNGPREPLVYDIVNAKDSEAGPDEDREHERTESGFKKTGKHEITST
jgi:hypothetical protein